MIKYKYFILILIFPIFISAQSNLKWGSPLSMDSKSPKVGQEITFRAVVSSIGGSARAVRIVGGINREQILSKKISKLGISQNVVIEFSWTPAVVGEQTAFFQILSGRKRGDSNLNDNRIERTFKVESSPNLTRRTYTPVPKDVRIKRKLDVKTRPILVETPNTPVHSQAQVQDIALKKVEPIICEPALPQIIVEDIKVFDGPKPYIINHLYTVEILLRNIGQCETGNFGFQLKVYQQQWRTDQLDVLLVGNRTVGSIKPFKTATVSFQYSFGYQAAQYIFYAIPDYNNLIEEYCEINSDIDEDYCIGDRGDSVFNADYDDVYSSDAIDIWVPGQY